MKEITIISGKGGTGKTSVTAALASLGEKLVLCDADVDAADLHLILQPEVLESHVFEGAWVAGISQDDCTRCGICFDHCKFDAISFSDKGEYNIDSFGCEGCRLCERVCPAGAIHSKRSTANHWFVSRTRAGYMTHAHMGPGEENSGKLVTRVRTKAREVAKEQEAEYILTDGPPGTGCSAIASITGTDAVLLVTEASQSSLHDAIRVIELIKSFDIPSFALINKADMNLDICRKMEKMLDAEKIPVLGKLPFDETVVKAMIAGSSITEYAPESAISKAYYKVWESLSI